MDDMIQYDFCKPYITQDEYILWKGKPEKGHLITGGDMIMMIFGIFWLSFCFFFEYSIIQSQSSLFFILWGIPFILVGLYLVFGRLIQKIYLRNKIFYVITNKKIMIKHGNKIEMYDGSQLPPMEIHIHKNGNGTILFSETVYTRRGRNYRTYFMLENLSDVAQAQNVIDMMDK